eukprot:605651-Pelagomonas_calceolata.AAC.1
MAALSLHSHLRLLDGNVGQTHQPLFREVTPCPGAPENLPHLVINELLWNRKTGDKVRSNVSAHLFQAARFCLKVLLTS